MTHTEELPSCLAGGWEKEMGLNEPTVIRLWRGKHGQHVKLEFE